MNRSDLVNRVAKRTGLTAGVVRNVLAAIGDVAVEELVEGGTIPVPRVGRISATWRAATVIRSVSSARRMFVDGRYVARFKPSSDLREALANRAPQHWRDPAHQAAWRHAETLVADLALYHGASAPHDLPAEAPPEQVDAACKAAFGSLWDQTRRAWAERTPPAVLESADHLARSALKRWAPPPPD